MSRMIINNSHKVIHNIMTIKVKTERSINIPEKIKIEYVGDFRSNPYSSSGVKVSNVGKWAYIDYIEKERLFIAYFNIYSLPPSPTIASDQLSIIVDELIAFFKKPLYTTLLSD